jgi:hypothetical protein
VPTENGAVTSAVLVHLTRWNRPTSTGADASDPLWLWEAYLAIRWRGYAASKWSQLEGQLILGQRPLPIATIAASAHACGGLAPVGCLISSPIRRTARAEQNQPARIILLMQVKIA